MSVPAYPARAARAPRRRTRARRCSRCTVTVPGKSLVCGIDAGGPGDDYAHALASLGYVVLAPDLRGFGERARLDAARQVPLRLGSRVRDDGRRRPARAQPLGSRARARRAERAPARRPGTRSRPPGLSYGGTCTLFLAALDERVRVAVVSGYLSSWRAAHTVPWNMCGSQVMPGQLGAIEHLDIAALVAPRPLLVESGTDDVIFPAGRGARDGRAAPRVVRRGSARPTTRSCTTCSTVIIGGTAPQCRHSWRGGCEHDRRTPARRWGWSCPGPYPPHDPLDAIVVHGGRARTSGQLPRDHDGKLVHPGRARRRALGRRGRGGRALVRARTRCRCCAPGSVRSIASRGCSPCSGFVASAPGLRATARGGRRREQAAVRGVRRRRPPHPFRDRRRRASPRRRGRDRGRGRTEPESGLAHGRRCDS